MTFLTKVTITEFECFCLLFKTLYSCWSTTSSLQVPMSSYYTLQVTRLLS